MTSRLSPLLTYFIPATIFILLLISEFIVPVAQKPGFNSESGPIENFQAIVLAIAFVTSVRAFAKAPTRLLKIWTGLSILGLIYVLGEEISWGQHVFEWSTPAEWAAINDQNETNLHNTSSWLDQKPRILVELGVFTGGLVIPYLRRYKPGKLPAKYAEIYPNSQLVFTAALATFAKASDFLSKIDIKIFWRASEVVEFYVYYFILLYLLALLRQFRIRTEG